MKWLLWMSVLFFLSCGKSFEKEAEQHLDKIIEDTAIDPGAYSGGYPFSISGDIRSVPS